MSRRDDKVRSLIKMAGVVRHELRVEKLRVKETNCFINFGERNA